MYKHKIIYKDLRVRQRLREERGLQRQFTTYTFPEPLESTETLEELEDAAAPSSGQAEPLESTETLEELEDAAAPSSGQDWCIAQEQNDWEIEEFINGLYYYEIDTFEKELLVQVEKRNRLEQINAEYLEKMGVFTRQEDVGGGQVRFQGLFRVKCFSNEEDAAEIKDLEERLQAVNFQG